MKSIHLLSFLFLTQLSFGQTAGDKFFSPTGAEVGSYYYPEHWPEDQWEKNLTKMKELGFTFTHFGEFAWTKMEPEEGKYDFAWLDKAISIAHSKGLKVILCTPTPTPPAWLTSKHPDVLVVDENGITKRHGARQHASWSSMKYREYVGKIVTKLAEKYGNDKRIWGWQLDNEPSHYGTYYDYSEPAQARFKEWLKTKYGTIAELNKRWGNEFWSMTYSDFNQIRIPNQKELVAAPSPLSLLDFQEFNNGEMTDFLKFQADILRSKIDSKQFITTNYMVVPQHIDPYPGKNNLDFASYTQYPLNSYSDYSREGAEGFRTGNGYGYSFVHDFIESVNGYTGVMELQPGQINWGRYNSQPLPGAVQLWVLHNYAMGSRFICNYRFRQPVYGNELYHQGIIEPDGESVSMGGKEYAKAIKVIDQVTKNEDVKAKEPELWKKGRTAIIWDRKSVLDLENFKHNNQWNTIELIHRYYRILKSFGVDIVFKTPNEDLDPKETPFVVVPSVQLIKKEWVLKWSDYVKKGGNLIISPRTGQKNRDAILWTERYQKPMEELVGVRFPFSDQMPPEKKAKVQMNGEGEYDWGVYGEMLEINSKSCKALGTYSNQFYKGKVAVVQNELGKGSVLYNGVCSASDKMEKDLLTDFYKSKKVSIMDLKDWTFYEWRNGVHFILNYSGVSYEYQPEDGAEILFGDKDLDPTDVLIWK